MNWNWKEYRKQKHQFRSYCCASCKQVKSCGILNKEYCCSCAYQIEQERTQEHSTYEKVLAKKQRERKDLIQQLQSLRNYQGCRDCSSKEVDAYSLYENNQLVCQPCRIKKEGGASGPISFLERQKWYKKQWGIELGEWLEKYQCLPVNKNCADKWLKDREHLNSCKCLEREVKNLVDLFTSSLREIQEKLKECQCETSPKVRVNSDYYAWCEKCGESVAVASKKRVIKNRNDPRFWGLEVKEKVLCGNCLESKKKEMKPLRRAKFNEYQKLGIL